MIAITRLPSPAIASCELTHLARQAIDVGEAQRQHAAYEAALTSLGVEIVRLDDAPFPDGVFVEDTAVVLPELAVLCRPGAESRREEPTATAAHLARYRPLVSIESPGTMDGGDVLVLGKTIFVGTSGRTNAEGIEQLRQHVAPRGYEVVPVRVEGCLHLKTAVTEIGDGLLLVQPRWIDLAPFARYARVAIDPTEPFGANALRIGGTVLAASHHPRTAKRIAAYVPSVVLVDNSELAKAEAGLTCCSILVP